MIDEYIIMNRRPNKWLYIYFFFLALFIAIAIYGTCFLFQKCIFQFHSKILYDNSQYYLEVQVPLKEVNKLEKKGVIIIDSKSYQYSLLKISSSSFYQHHQNYVMVYLNVFHLEKRYLYAGYEMDIMYFSE